MSLFSPLNSAVLNAFGQQASWTRSPDNLPGSTVTITGIVAPPAMLENFPAGSSQGVSVVRFWVDLNQLPQPGPAVGQTVVLGGVNYDIFDVDTDPVNGSMLKLRRNA